MNIVFKLDKIEIEVTFKVEMVRILLPDRFFKLGIIAFVVIAFVILNSANINSQIELSTPFERMIPELERPENTSVESLQSEEEEAITPKLDTIYVDPQSLRKSYVYRPRMAFTLVVSSERYPDIKPDKSIFGVISLKITPDYQATSNVIYAKKKYHFDRLSWAIRTGWNETIPFFSRLSAFKKYLKPFSTPVYAHFYIRGIKEYPEYPTQYYHYPREALEDYYLYILRKIDAVAIQN